MSETLNSDRLELLTPKEAAAALRCCEDTLRNHVRKGALPAPIRVGGRPRYVLADLQAFIRSAIRLTR